MANTLQRVAALAPRVKMSSRHAAVKACALFSLSHILFLWRHSESPLYTLTLN